MSLPPALPAGTARVRPGAGDLFNRYSTTVLALTTTAGAQAAIIYSNPTDVTLAVGGFTRVNFLTGSFAGSGLRVYNMSADYAYVIADNHVSATAKGIGGVGILSRLSAGASIGIGGGAGGWMAGWNYVDYHNNSGYPWNTNANGTTGYVGVRLNNNGTTAGTYYGWLRMTYDDASNSLTLHDFAYETTADLAILAGATAVPEPAATGILAALGAGGLATWRRLRKGRHV